MDERLPKRAEDLLIERTVSPTLPAAEPRSDDRGAPALTERYEDLGRIARGGSGEVRRVLDRVLGRPVAMKVSSWEHVESEPGLRRFLREVQITSSLEHPGIVPVHDRGTLPDGRVFFTMREVRGRTFGDVIRDVHDSAGAGRFQVSESGWTFRRLVESFTRVCETVGYAHSKAVVHRDLKPSNLMVGPFGEVLVMDWGIACTRGTVTDHGDATGGDADAALLDPVLTRTGEVVGTVAYMSPEQALGGVPVEPTSDVYSLGLVLYEILVGRRALSRGDRSSWQWTVQSGPPPVRSALDASSPAVPEELVEICERAIRREPEDRYAHAGALAEALRSWLDGDLRRSEALEIHERAVALEPAIAEARATERELRARAAAQLAELRSFDPDHRKLPAWQLEDEADALAAEVARLETTWLETLGAALERDPDLAQAHARLADCYHAKVLEAEARRQPLEAARHEHLLRRHDRGRHASFLSGTGELTLVTDPPGARVVLHRYRTEGRRARLVDPTELGATPLSGVTLPAGSYLVELCAEGREVVRYPVRIGRGERWEGVRPGSSEPTAVFLPARGTLGPDEVYVPAGWFVAGGDPRAPEPVARRRVWVDGFAIGRFPVTYTEYLAYLDDLVARGLEDEALARAPRQPLGAFTEGAAELAVTRDARGRFGLGDDETGRRVEPDWPVALVDWHGANAFLAWLGARTHRALRLPNELEWEKAARGVDERSYPWGMEPEPTWACLVGSTEHAPSRCGVGAYPVDESPYGMRGAAGNVRDWCTNVWRHDGPTLVGDVLSIDAAPEDDASLRVLRGGCWSTVPDLARAAGRFGGRPTDRFAALGFRIARSLPPR